MNLLSLVFIALGLSMDAFAVSVTNGIVIKNLQFKHAVKIALYFGGFQGLMPVVGWSIGKSFSSYIIEIDHWVAFFVLGFIGIRMVIGSLKKEDENSCEKKDEKTEEKDPISNKTLLMLAIATSIDALAVGVSFSFLNVSIISSAIIIASITFSLSLAGVIFGEKCGSLFQKKAETLGGVILTLIGLKILIEHTGMLSIFGLLK